jgi:hypothetical protein
VRADDVSAHPGYVCRRRYNCIFVRETLDFRTWVQSRWRYASERPSRGNRTGIPLRSIYAKQPTRDSLPKGKVRNLRPIRVAFQRKKRLSSEANG